MLRRKKNMAVLLKELLEEIGSAVSNANYEL